MTRRRVVTGVDAEGRAVIVSNGPSSGRFTGGSWEELWAFDGVPAHLDDAVDPVDVPTFRMVPEPGRIAIRIFTVRPADDRTRPEEERAADDEEWFRRLDFTGIETGEPPPGCPDCWMHRHPTVDVIMVISGEMDLVLDGGETVHLVPGDSVIQRGTMHAWHTAGPEPCVAVAFGVGAV